MSDNLSVNEQTVRIERATREDEKMRYFLFTSVSTENNKQQLHIYIYGQDQEGPVKNEARRLGMIEVNGGCFNWPQPRGDMVTATVILEDFSCKRELETSKLTSTRYPGKITYNLPSTSQSTEIIGNVEMLDQEFKRQLFMLTNIKFPHCPQVTRHGNEHDESSSAGNENLPQEC